MAAPLNLFFTRLTTLARRSRGRAPCARVDHQIFPVSIYASLAFYIAAGPATHLLGTKTFVVLGRAQATHSLTVFISVYPYTLAASSSLAWPL